MTNTAIVLILGVIVVCAVLLGINYFENNCVGATVFKSFHFACVN